MPETPNTETVQVVGIGAHQIVEGGCTPGRPGDHHNRGPDVTSSYICSALKAVNIFYIFIVYLECMVYV